ncbi:SH3 domain-containing protein [Bogoriella caseilytica]|uniref:SH3 domain-containing protein n=1 Tax=Bogoriella caseilytica TaxID=56055 RepID=A0A3N2B9Y9_9MICO|nr:SH3 domain-containing protein [Bogoriella caseilytica]ROR72093.1 hypothetical protein EDD31_0440 [Bogoriella caseilytica]
MRSIRPGMITITAAAALMLAACENGDEPDQPDPGVTATDEPTESEPTEEDTDEPEPEPEPEPTDEAGDEGDENGAGEGQDDGAGLPPGGVERVDESALPGTETMMYFSTEGSTANVVRVEYDDVLNVRAMPAADTEIVGEIEPTGAVTLAGRERMVEGSGDLWAEVELAEGYGWVNSTYLAFLAATEDVTADFDEVPPAEEPSAIANSVGERVADSLEGDDDAHGPWPEWVVIGSTEVDGGWASWVDVTGMGDDSVLGYRYHVVMSETEGYEIQSVSATAICSRGVSEEDGEMLCL